MKNVILPIVLVALLAGCVKREETMVGGIYGTVKDAETAQPLAGCSVMLMPGGMTIVTGEDGAFHFEDVLPDTYSLEASCYGYYSNKKSIVVMAGESPMAVDVLLTRYDPNNRLAELGAMTVGEVTFRSARFQCEVIDQGSSSVTERGFLYSETPNVTIATATKKAVNTTDAIFSMTVTGLAEETEYYVTTISAYIIVFLIFYFGIKLIAMLLKETLRALNLGGFDRAGGALFGALKYLLMLSLVLNALYAIEPDASLFHSSGLMEGRVFALVMRMAPWAWGVDIFPNTIG